MRLDKAKKILYFCAALLCVGCQNKFNPTSLRKIEPSLNDKIEAVANHVLSNGIKDKYKPVKSLSLITPSNGKFVFRIEDNNDNGEFNPPDMRYYGDCLYIFYTDPNFKQINLDIFPVQDGYAESMYSMTHRNFTIPKNLKDPNARTKSLRDQRKEIINKAYNYRNRR